MIPGMQLRPEQGHREVHTQFPSVPDYLLILDIAPPETANVTHMYSI